MMSYLRCFRRWNCLTCIICVLLITQVAHAQDAERKLPNDQAVIQPGGRISTQLTLNGVIEDYTGDTLKIRLKPEVAANEYPAADVLRVSTWHVPAHDRGLKHMAQHNWAQAVTELQAGYAREDRHWVRRMILVSLVKCYLQQGDYLNASGQFVLLLRSDPRTRELHLLPLAWTTSPPLPNPSLNQQAELWLNAPDSEPVIRLLGASHSLFNPALTQRAREALKKLSVQSDRRISRWALSQLWRTRVGQTADINTLEFQYWQTRLESLPEDDRSGPYYVLGTGLVTLREYELGAAYLLWTPLTHDQDHHLAGRACLEAATALAEIGQYSAAATLYREVSERFSQTPFAATAEQEQRELDEKLRQSRPPSETSAP